MATGKRPGSNDGALGRKAPHETRTGGSSGRGGSGHASGDGDAPQDGLARRFLDSLGKLLDRILTRPSVRVLFVILFAAAGALVLTPGLRRRGPLLKASDVGRPARRDVKASRSFQYMPPADVLRARREAAAHGTLTVYDYYPIRLHFVYSALQRALAAATNPEGLYRTHSRPAAGQGGSGQGGATHGVKSVTGTTGGMAAPRGDGAGPSGLSGMGAATSGDKTVRSAAGTTSPVGMGAGTATAAGSLVPDTTKHHSEKPDLRKVRQQMGQRFELFNRLMDKELGSVVRTPSHLSKEDFAVLYRWIFADPANRQVIDGVLRSVLLDEVLLDKKFVRSVADLKSDLGKPQQRIVVRTMRAVRGGRQMPSREQVLGSLSSIQVLRDLQDRVALKVTGIQKLKGKELRRALASLVMLGVVENMVRNDAETEHRRQEARSRIADRPIPYVKGQILVRLGQVVTEEDLRVVEAMEGDRSITGPWQVAGGMALFLLLFFFVLVRYGHNQLDGFFVESRDLFVAGALLLGLLGFAELLSLLGGALDWSSSLVNAFMPLAAGAILVRLLLGGPAGLAFAAGSAGFAALALDGGVTVVLYLFVGSLVGAGAVAKVENRFVLWRAGGLVALANVVMVVFLRTFAGSVWNTGTLLVGAAGILGGLAAGFLGSALLPVLEWMGGYTTDVILLELANSNHPLLQELIKKAPGTHHHSMIVGTLAEAGANSVGANGLLARVSAYYHDVGKMKNPQYFAENHQGDNPHERLKPSMSALVIKNHVKDTRDILSRYRIPRVIQDTALSHHGTTLIEYFYDKAKAQAGEDDEVFMDDFRYPGPKPQTREAGILMLADAVEAAAKSLANPDEEQLRSVVDRIINKKFIDGQLAECNLTLRDLSDIAGAFLNVLMGMYHHRPVYPGQKEGWRDPQASPQSVKAITTTRDLKMASRAKERAEKLARNTERLSMDAALAVQENEADDVHAVEPGTNGSGHKRGPDGQRDNKTRNFSSRKES